MVLKRLWNFGKRNFCDIGCFGQTKLFSGQKGEKQQEE